MPIVLDIQATQNPTDGERGIPRFTFELALALDRTCPDLVSAYAFNPDLTVPDRLNPLRESGKLVSQDELVAECHWPLVYHVGSPFERVGIDRLWPRVMRGDDTPLVVTHYDLIPLFFPDIYLADPVDEARYRTRLEFVAGADRLLVLSRASARDVVEQLGVSPRRIAVVGAGVSARFVPPTSRAAALRSASVELPGLEPAFLMLTGAGDERKGADRLIAAYGALPSGVRADAQLVLVGRIAPHVERRLRRAADELSIGERVRFTGLVSDDLLVRLYQACGLFVFPSLYEGFGLPVAEAIACGAPVIVADTSSLVEVVPDADARFDAESVSSLRDAIVRALTAPGGPMTLELDPGWTWDSVASRVAAVYGELV